VVRPPSSTIVKTERERGSTASVAGANVPERKATRGRYIRVIDPPRLWDRPGIGPSADTVTDDLAEWAPICKWGTLPLEFNLAPWMNVAYDPYRGANECYSCGAAGSLVRQRVALQVRNKTKSVTVNRYDPRMHLCDVCYEPHANRLRDLLKAGRASSKALSDDLLPALCVESVAAFSLQLAVYGAGVQPDLIGTWPLPVGDIARLITFLQTPDSDDRPFDAAMWSARDTDLVRRGRSLIPAHPESSADALSQPGSGLATGTFLGLVLPFSFGSDEGWLLGTVGFRSEEEFSTRWEFGECHVVPNTKVSMGARFAGDLYARSLLNRSLGGRPALKDDLGLLQEVVLEAHEVLKSRRGTEPTQRELHGEVNRLLRHQNLKDKSSRKSISASYLWELLHSRRGKPARLTLQPIPPPWWDARGPLGDLLAPFVMLWLLSSLAETLPLGLCLKLLDDAGFTDLNSGPTDGNDQRSVPGTEAANVDT
jgi:hypothetical protein